MIDYNLLNYLEERNRSRQLEKETRSCYITSKLTIRYKQYRGRYTPNTFESILRKTIPPLNTIILRWHFISENLIEYRIQMPVEVFPFLMQAIYEIEIENYPFKIENEKLIYSYFWDRRE